MDKLKYISEIILPCIAKNGRLGKEMQFVKCLCDDSSSGERQFASSVCFVVAVFRLGENTFEQPLLIKFNMGDETVRNWLKLNYQFQNEVFVYEQVLPFLNNHNKPHLSQNNVFPKYFYGSAVAGEDPSGYTIVLEDLRSSDFKLCPEILDLDFAHCALAFRKLGCYHALSYAAKQLNNKTFFDIVNNLVETKLFEENQLEWNYLYTSSVRRAAEKLLERGENIEGLQNFREKLKDTYAYIKNILKVEEPMAVICHGDFCRNNVLYKYENAMPIDIKFFDFATARYGSPMLDFSFFFFLNCSEESRKQHRQDFLQIYHTSLSSTILGINVPSLEDFVEEFRQKAVYGFLLCSFFKPAMMDPVPFNPFVEVQKSVEDRTIIVLQNGGEKATEVIANMLRELTELKCVL